MSAIIFFLTTALHADTTNPLTIGLAVCLSGPCALDGQNTINGATLAASDINASGGILGRPIQFEIEDTQDAITGAKAVTAYYALRNNKKIQLFIGPSWTPGALALAPIVSRDKEAMIIGTNGGVREFHEAGENIFNIRGIDESGTRALARHAFDQGAKTAAVFGSQQAWELLQTGYFEDEFKRAGGTVVMSLAPIPTMPDLNAEILKIVQKKPDVVLLAAYTQLDIALKALKKLHYSGRVIVALIDSSRIKLAGESIEGAISIDFLKLSNDFTTRLKKEFPATEPGWPAYTAYDAVMSYKKGIEAAHSFSPKAILQEIPKLTFSGMSGPLSFNGGRLAVRTIKDSFRTVRNGTLEPLP